MRLMQNKVVVITGAAKGVGAACANLIAQNGAERIFVVDVDFESVKAQALSIAAKNGCECIPIKADVSQEREVKIVYDIVKEKAGRVDVLVNSAGVDSVMRFDELDIKAWDVTTSENFRGAFLFSKEALEMMRMQKKGTIINVAPQTQINGEQSADANDSFSKAGLLCLTKTLARNAAEYGVTVNSVSAKLFKRYRDAEMACNQPIVSIKRVNAQKEVVDTVLFLASDHARYMTGACIDINVGVAI